jgi:hypothetical protein
MDAPAKKNVGIALILAWIVPGLGHFYLGRRGKAVIFLVLIVSAFVYGMWLGDFSNVNPLRYGKAFIAEVFTGTPAVAGLAVDQFRAGTVDEGPQKFDVSFVYTCVAGLLNLLVIVDAVALAFKGEK